jgi:RNA polymerase sigma-70 factor (ECF subfamily)
MYDFEKLCLPCYPELLAFATKRTKCKHKAEDIVQEAVAKGLAAWDNWEPLGEPEKYARAWMFRIVSNVFSLWYQRDKTLARLTDKAISSEFTFDQPRAAEVDMVTAELHQAPVAEHPYSNIGDFELGDEVQDALARIKPEWADVVRLVYIEGVPAHEAAQILQVAPGTIRSRMARGRLALARILSPFARQRFGYAVKAELGSAAEALTEVVISDEYESIGDRVAYEPATTIHA